MPVTVVPVSVPTVIMSETPVQPDCIENKNAPPVTDVVEPPPVILSPKPSLMKRKTVSLTQRFLFISYNLLL